MLFRWVLAADTCKQVQMGWRWGSEAEQQNKKGGRRVKKKGADGQKQNG